MTFHERLAVLASGYLCARYLRKGGQSIAHRTLQRFYFLIIAFATIGEKIARLYKGREFHHNVPQIRNWVVDVGNVCFGAFAAVSAVVQESGLRQSVFSLTA